jgi:hypothetical protein
VNLVNQIRGVSVLQQHVWEVLVFLPARRRGRQERFTTFTRESQHHSKQTFKCGEHGLTGGSPHQCFGSPLACQGRRFAAWRQNAAVRWSRSGMLPSPWPLSQCRKAQTPRFVPFALRKTPVGECRCGSILRCMWAQVVGGAAGMRSWARGGLDNGAGDSWLSWKNWALVGACNS